MNSFEKKVVKNFRYQYNYNNTYKEFCDLINKNIDVSNIKNIPFLPIEFFNSFKFVNSSFADLIANITFAILTSLFFLIFFQILLPSNTIILQEVVSLTRANSFSGFIVIPILIFILNNFERKFSELRRFSFGIILLVWILSSQFFI